jgi:hypothetical protein
MMRLVNHGAKERTRAEFKALLVPRRRPIGPMRVAKVHGRGAMGLLEIYLKRWLR